MILISDKGQQKGKHTAKENYWKDSGIEVLTMPLPCGDYIIANERVMDVINRKNERGIPVKKMPFNLLGQICLPFTVIWFFLSAVAVVLDDWIRHLLWGEDIPHYKWR